MDHYNALTDALITLLVAMVPVISGFLIKFIQLKTKQLQDSLKNDELSKYLGMLTNIVMEVVDGLDQSTVDDLKKANADGKLTSEEKEEIKQEAIETVLNTLGDGVVKVLEELYGDLGLVIDSKIEWYLRMRKRVESNKSSLGLGGGGNCIGF